MAKVLMVEDDEVIARDTAEHLQAAGFDPILVSRGDMGLARLRDENPDVCVVDLMLPDLDGWRLIETVRSEGMGTPILAISAGGTEHDGVDVLEIGADDYLVKPFSMKEFVAGVKTVVRRSGVLDAETRLIGSTLGGYTIESVLGGGATATVYLATHPRLKPKVALKVLSTEISRHPVFRERFIREGWVASSLTHPNVIPIYDAGESGGVLWMAMGYAEAGDLDLVARKGRLPLRQTIVIVEQVASALDAAHAASLLHLDVTRRNILLGAAGHVYLSDFGAALRLGDSYPRQAPRIARRRRPRMTSADNWRDIRALGHVAYRCLAGRVPLKHPTIQEHGRVPLSILHPGLPAALDDVLAKAMAGYPEVHFWTAGAMANAFRLAGLGPQSRGITPSPHLSEA